MSSERRSFSWSRILIRSLRSPNDVMSWRKDASAQLFPKIRSMRTMFVRSFLSRCRCVDRTERIPSAYVRNQNADAGHISWSFRSGFQEDACHARQCGLEGSAVKKMVTPAVKREAVAHLKTEHEMSERRACRVIRSEERRVGKECRSRWS